MTQWSPQQVQALDAVGQWIRDKNKPWFYLAGYAGTGKTTLARHLAATAGNVVFGAYTGKAALVLRRSGCAGASTIHSMIYKSMSNSPQDMARMVREHDQLKEKPERTEAEQARLERLAETIKREQESKGRPRFRLNLEAFVENRPDLIVLDECSMLGVRMAEDILSFGIPVLTLGDPAQLPPVGDGGYFTNHKPDFLLTEVHRQAAESPILRLATLARQGRSIPLGSYGEGVEVVGERGESLAARVMKTDQVLVGRNKTRHSSNARYRQLSGLDNPTPVPGDKLVCLRNNHDVGLLNGSLWRVHEAEHVAHAGSVHMLISSEDEPSKSGFEVISHDAHFLGKEDKMTWWDKRSAEEFDFGYALTVHKSQGSQWQDVLLIDESAAFRENASNWLYTAITRASERLTIVK
jgi:exodeoxyribonuclease-5